MICKLRSRLPETNSKFAPENRVSQKDLNQPSIFRCELLVSGRVDSGFQQVETLNHLILMVKVWKFISTAIVCFNVLRVVLCQWRSEWWECQASIIFISFLSIEDMQQWFASCYFLCGCIILIGSMYGIFTCIWLIFMANVGKYPSPMDPLGIYLNPCLFVLYFEASTPPREGLFNSNQNRVKFGFHVYIWAIYNDLSRGHPKW